MGEHEQMKMEAVKDLAEEKLVAYPLIGDRVDDSRAVNIVEKSADPPLPEKSFGGSVERDAVLARVQTEKRMSLIKAWEDSEKTKADNKAQKKMSLISSWENSKMAAVEADLRKIEEAIEKKAEYAEKMKNKIAMIHKAAEEKRAMVEAMHEEELLKAEEAAAKYRATGLSLKKSIGCFGH